jgi:hypothetical protein
MSLFEQASLIVTPNATKAGKLYSIKPTSGAGDLSVTRATTKTRTNSLGVIESVPINVAALDYTNGSCPSILVEPQRINLVLRSEEFDDAYWTKVNTTITANNAVAPDGTSSADSLVLTSVSPDVQSLSRQTAIVSSTTTITFSTFVKYVDKQYIQLVFSGSFSFQFANFDLINGTVTAGTYVSANVQSYANGWYRISITTTGLNTNVLPFIWSIDTPLAIRAANSTSTGTSSYLIWGAQLEAGSNATSYIPTVASAVTRNADVISKTGISDLIGQTEGTIFLDFIYKTPISDTHGQIGITSNASPFNRVVLWNNVTLNTLAVTLQTNGATIYNVSLGTFINNNRYKIAILYSSGNSKFFVNGLLANSSTSVFSFTSNMSAIYLGAYQTNQPFPYQETNLAAVYPTALSDAELIQLTTL